jgi:hypothetical protein
VNPADAEGFYLCNLTSDLCNQRGPWAAFFILRLRMGLMASYPIEIRRCRHVKTNGTQCGSPALKARERCYFHEQNQPQPVELFLDGERTSDSSIVLPVFEDAHSIQTVIRQVVQLMLSRRIDRKDAGVLLYALQIASGNLKTMQAEKAKPTQVVMEPDKAAETPLGMTPWSATGKGHDPDDAAIAEAEHWLAFPPSAEECYRAMSGDERDAMRQGLLKKGLVTERDLEARLHKEGPDPALPAMKELREQWERMTRA